MVNSWIAFDRHGRIRKLIADRTHYNEEVRLARLDEFVLALDSELDENKPENNWGRYPPFICFSRLRTVYEAIIGSLFAYNRQWRFYGDREAKLILDFGWVPTDIETRLLRAANAPSLDRAGFSAQAEALRGLSREILDRLKSDGVYGDDPGSEAFIRRNDEPGRAWNMDEWNTKHETRNASR